MRELTAAFRNYFRKAPKEECFYVSVSFFFFFLLLRLCCELPNIPWSDMFIRKLFYVADAEFPQLVAYGEISQKPSSAHAR